MKKFFNMLFSICFSLFIILGIIRFTVGFRQLYYFDINYLDIPKISSLSEDEIKANYDYLIDYNLNIKEEEFKLPTIQFSPQGKIHFEEVRDIFQGINKITLGLLAVCIVGVFIKIKNKQIDFLNKTSKLLLILPIIVLVPMLISFDKTFTIFHKLFFDNDYWIFDPSMDPVINILPQEFFFHAGVMIIILVLIFSLVTRMLYKKLNKKYNSRRSIFHRTNYHW